ncbi:MAG: PGRS repeat-containing protein, partial [Mycobacterium sp.]
MTRRHTGSQPGSEVQAGARRGNRAIGTGSAVAAFLAFGMAPLAGAPAAQADGFEDLFDFSWLTPADVTSDVDPGLAAFDPAAFDMITILDQWFYTPLHMGMTAWIDSDFGAMVNNAINEMSGQYLIGNGAAGTELNPDGGDGGLWFGDGGAGWSSDADGVAGGNGGDALGWLGNGGDGGA